MADWPQAPCSAQQQPEARLVTRELQSRALERRVTYAAYVPAHLPGESLPQLFLLHGAEASYTDFVSHAHALLQRLAAHHHMLIVLPEGSRDGWYLDSPRWPTHRYATHLLHEVVPDAELWLPPCGRRGITGISAGGNAALLSALKHSRLFRSASSMSGALDLSRASQRPALTRALGEYEASPALWLQWSARHALLQDPTRARRVPILLSVGSDDIWAGVNRQTSAELRARCIPHLFFERPGGHTWEHWVTVLPRHLAFHARLLNARP